MIAKCFSLLVLVSAACATTFFDVDPNTLSCDPLGQEFLLLPHFEDCDKFYTCDHGLEKEFSCAPGTIFDFPLQTCNHPWATQCWLRTREDEVEGSGEASGDLEWFSEDVVRQDAPAILTPVTGTLRAGRPSFPAETPGLDHFATNLDCSNARDAAKQVAFNGDCQRYWRCSDGLLVSMYCSDGLFFNAQTQQCDHEANVKCLFTSDDELGGEFLVYN